MAEVETRGPILKNFYRRLFYIIKSQIKDWKYGVFSDERYPVKKEVRKEVLLVTACQKGDIEAVRELLKNNSLIDCFQGMPILHAALNNQMEIVKYLAEEDDLIQNSDIHAYDNQLFKTLCYNGSLESVQYLVEKMNIMPIDLEKWVLETTHMEKYIEVCSIVKNQKDRNLIIEEKKSMINTLSGSHLKSGLYKL